MVPIVRDRLGDTSAQVRRECLLALRHHPDPEAADLWASLALKHDGKDRWYLEALGIAADGQWNRFFEAWLKEVDEDWRLPPGQDIIWRSRADAALPLLAELIKTSATEEHPRYFRAFDFHTQNPQLKKRALESLLQK